MRDALDALWEVSDRVCSCGLCRWHPLCQSIDAMAAIHMLTTLVWVLIAFRFIDPTQMVGKVRVQKSS